jgi:hypothetical protein
MDVLEKTIPALSASRRMRNHVDSMRPLSAVAIVAAVGGILLFRQMKPVQRIRTPLSRSQSRLPRTSPASGKPRSNTIGDTYAETFDLVAGPELSGTTSLFQHDRGIFDGKIEGDRISFMTKSQTSLNEKTFEDKHYYKGTLDGDTIRFSMLTDSGAESHVPIHFTATR